MEYNERDVSDDEQIVDDNEHDESEDEEDGEPEDEEDGEPEEDEDKETEEEEDEEKNPWVGIREDVEEWHKKKLEALITEFQESGDSEEVAAVKAYNSLLPLYREDLKDVLLEELKWICAMQGSSCRDWESDCLGQVLWWRSLTSLRLKTLPHWQE